MVVAVGHLKPWKGQRQVLDALLRLPARTRERIMVLFAGTASPLEADYRAELEQVIASGGLAGSVRLLGARDDVPDLMRAADVVLHSSIAPEPFGLVVVEAMALGVPVVASPLGGPAEIVTPGTGLLVDPRDVEALASALGRMADDAAFRASLAAAGRVRAEDFAVERTVAAIEAVYDELLARP
jgi:glycosyltransferase involved in cell wall biosynthesis